MVLAAVVVLALSTVCNAYSIGFSNVTKKVPGYNRLTGYPMWRNLVPGFDQQQADSFALLSVTCLTAATIVAFIFSGIFLVLQQSKICTRNRSGDSQPSPNSTNDPVRTYLPTTPSNVHPDSKVKRRARPNHSDEYTLLADETVDQDSSIVHPGSQYCIDSPKITSAECPYLHPKSSLNPCIAFYIFTTLFAAVSMAALGPGKLFAISGGAHNMAEIAILILFTNNGHFKPSIHVPILLVYLVSVVTAVLMLSWPDDALFFKTQGLVLDFMLIFQWLRLYKTTSAYYKSHLVSVSQCPHFQNHVDAIVPLNPANILLLVLSAVIHTAGNTTSTIFPHNAFFGYMFFHISYALAYPFMALYVYNEQHTAQFLIFPKSTVYSEVAVAGLSLCMSVSVILTALIHEKSAIVHP